MAPAQNRDQPPLPTLGLTSEPIQRWVDDADVAAIAAAEFEQFVADDFERATGDSLSS